MLVYWVAFAFPRTIRCKFWLTLLSSPKHRGSPQGACYKHIQVQLNLLGRHCVKIEWCFWMLKCHHSVVLSLHSRCKSKDSAKRSCQILIKLIGYQCYSYTFWFWDFSLEKRDIFIPLSIQDTQILITLYILSSEQEKLLYLISLERKWWVCLFLFSHFHFTLSNK